MIIKVVVGFLLIAFVETINGIFRVKILHKKLGVKQAKIVSFILGSLSIFVLNIFLVPWIAPQNIGEAFLIGFVWMSLMIAYDIYVGRVLFKLTWEKIFLDFNPLRGNPLALGMVLIFFLPSVVGLFILELF